MTPVFIIIIICINIIIIITAAQTDSKTLHLHNDANSITQASNDYGNIVHDKPLAVLDPWSVNDIIGLIKSKTNKTIAARGNGHSIRGQAMALGGVVVNMTTLRRAGNRIMIGRDYADVGAEQLWIDVLKATLARGLAPLSWTDYLHLTVGGTLSNAGISGQSFLHGPQISNVRQLAVVTGKGQHITCSPNTNKELFLGVLGGLGQFGIITRARIILDKAPTSARWAILIYSNFSTFTRDQENLIAAKSGVNYVEGFIIVGNSTIVNWRSVFPISPSDQSRILALLANHSILYAIEVAKYYDNHTANTIDLEFQELVMELNFIPGLNFSRDVSLFDFLYRVGNLDTPATGSLLSHPWLNLFIQKSDIVDFNKLVLAGMLPRLNQTAGIFIFYPMNKNKWNDAMSAVTVDGGVFYTVGLLHSSPAGQYKRFDDFNNEVLSVCRGAGINVKEYLPNYKTRTAWEKHFGSKWETFLNRKMMFDSKMLLSPGQGIFN